MDVCKSSKVGIPGAKIAFLDGPGLNNLQTRPIQGGIGLYKPGSLLNITGYSGSMICIVLPGVSLPPHYSESSFILRVLVLK
jgi:hypothetical protein